MEGGSRSQRWMNNNRRSQNKKPPHGSWHHNTVPSWEKDFCKDVGSFKWETFLQMKKYMQFDDNVINWNDSAGEEAFRHAKRRYYAEINGFSCDDQLPDPNLYIQDINWDSEITPDDLSVDLDALPVPPELGHEPVVIFGDSFVADQGFGLTGWGDAEEKFEVPAVNFSENYDEPREGQNWEPSGWQVCNNNNSNNNNNNNNNNDDTWKCGQGFGATGWGDAKDIFEVQAVNISENNGEPWEGKNWYSSGWQGCNNDDAWNCSDINGGGYTSRGGDGRSNGWGCADNNYNYVGPRVKDVRGGNKRYVPSNGTSTVQHKGRHRGSYWGKQDRQAGLRESNQVDSCGPFSQRAEVRVGEAWNR